MDSLPLVCGCNACISIEEEDGDFVPSAEMYVHDDIDDERTIDEEEALEQEQQDEGELDDLMKVRARDFN